MALMRAWIVTAALICWGCASERAEPLPEIPKLETEKFLPAIREEIRKAEEAARNRPQDAAASGKLGMILHAHGQNGAAEVCYQRAQQLDRRSFRWLYGLSLVQTSQGKGDAAEATLRRALAIDPDHGPAQLRRAELLLDLGRLEDSGAIYRKMTSQATHAATAFYGLGRVQSATGSAAAARESFQKACDLYPAYGAAHYALALAYRKAGDAAKASEHFTLYEKYKLTVPPVGDEFLSEIRRLNLATTSFLREAVDLEAAGRLEEAVALQLQALAVDPNLEQAHVNLVSLYGRLGRPADAEKHYRQAVALNPNFAEGHYNYGVLLYGQQKYREAKEAFARAVEINPYHAEAQHNLGQMLEHEGRLDAAAERYRQSLASNPGYRLAHFHLGRILVNRRDYAGAIAHFEKTLSPEDDLTPGFLYALGAAWARAGDRSRAVTYIRRARDGAASRRQAPLLASIERDLRILGQAGASQ